MIHSDQGVRRIHNRLLYRVYKEAYQNGELTISDGFYICYGDESLHFNDIKFVLQRLDVDRWVVGDEFDNMVIMNAYRLPCDYNINSYPCIIEFDGTLDGGRMTFTHKVLPYDMCQDCGNTGVVLVGCCSGYQCGCLGMPVAFEKCKCGMVVKSYDVIEKHYGELSRYMENRYETTQD